MSYLLGILLFLVAHIIDVERELKRFDKAINGHSKYIEFDEPCKEKLGDIRIDELGDTYICAKIRNKYVWAKL